MVRVVELVILLLEELGTAVRLAELDISQFDARATSLARNCVEVEKLKN
jgi:hypothetical protein